MDVRYTDRDVNDDPRLRALAEDYALNYGGNFDPLVAAKQLIETGASLPTGVARMVLNVMRSDARVANVMPQPEPNIMPRVPRKPRPQVVIEPEPPRRYPRNLKATFKKRYLYSVHERAFVAHLLEPEARMRFFPSTGQFQAQIRAICGASIRMVQMADTVPEGYKRCERCGKIEEERKANGLRAV
jgi:hypothetical protein